MARSSVRYTPPKKQAVAAVLNGPEIRAALAAEAERGKVFAVGLSQEFSDPADEGGYASKFEVGEGTIVVNEIERQTAVLRNTSGHAAAVEWGRYGSAADPGPKAHHILEKTADYLSKGGGG